MTTEWLADMAVLAKQIQEPSRYAGVGYMTLRDDADYPVREAYEELQHRVEGCHAKGKTPLVIPLLLSYGGIEDCIRKRLTGLEYRMPTQGLLLDGRIVRWVLDMAKATPTQPSTP